MKMKMLMSLLIIMFFLTMPQPMLGTDHDPLREKFEKWMEANGRHYGSNEEMEMRFSIFKNTVTRVEEHNKNYGHVYKQGVNKFADLTLEEFIAKYTGNMRDSYTPKSININVAANVEQFNGGIRHESFDWTKRGGVTEVKNQGNYNTCWAFSVVATMETYMWQKMGVLRNMSEQQLVDCVLPNDGSKGVYTWIAYEWIQHHGLETQDRYPYVGFQSECKDIRSDPVTRIPEFWRVQPLSETALEIAVTRQPISVVVCVNNDFVGYEGNGVFPGYRCDPLAPTHAVAIVGYGADSWGRKYWLVKNSWGKDWGVNGYMMLQRGTAYPEGACGVTLYAFYPKHY